MNHHDRAKANRSAATVEKDPICGMDVPADSPLRTERGGKTYVFCSQHCLDRFRADPDRYGASCCGHAAHRV